VLNIRKEDTVFHGNEPKKLANSVTILYTTRCAVLLQSSKKPNVHFALKRAGSSMGF
jgi:hypothetical protein